MEVDDGGYSDGDSLFGGSIGSLADAPMSRPRGALRRIPQGHAIPGLHFDPEIVIPPTSALELLRHIKEHNYFRGGTVNQLMLFERGQSGPVETSRDAPVNTEARLAPSSEDVAVVQSDSPLANALPSFLLDLISNLSVILDGRIPPSTHRLLFPTASLSATIPARQAILNLYRPGEGITPHVDLLQRFGDGIIIVSLGSGTVMELAPFVQNPGLHAHRPSADGGSAGDSPGPEPPRSAPLELWLEPRSILVMEGEARYKWTHGIPARDGDWVQDELQDGEEEYDEDMRTQWIARDVRVSITLRWLLPGAEIVGGPVGFAG